jgi:SAM-dependent methyltransferase
MASANYEIVGQHYADLRRPDPRIARLIHAELEYVESVINVGAGTGSYEPEGKSLIAVEPSPTMVAQRKDQSAGPVVRAAAEQLPFESGRFDAALAILTIHHWDDWEKGLREMQRVSRSKVVLFTWLGMPEEFWLFDYFPEIEHIDQHLFPSLDDLSRILGDVREVVVPIPKDCSDGFLCAYWARPEAYLDATIRSAISTFSRLDNLDDGLRRLKTDLDSGEWMEKNTDLTGFGEFDFGYRLIVADL